MLNWYKQWNFFKTVDKLLGYKCLTRSGKVLFDTTSNAVFSWKSVDKKMLRMVDTLIINNKWFTTISTLIWLYKSAKVDKTIELEI